MAWLMLHYDPISTFELRPSNTTKTGGKTLLVPTPYAIKMGFLDRIIRNNGLAFGKNIFPAIRDLQIAIRPPRIQAINRTFQKILRPKTKNTWNQTIAMREFCVQSGELEIALSSANMDDALSHLLLLSATSINYFGQRGSFFQLVAHERHDALPSGFVNTAQSSTQVQLGFLQRMDDMQADASFEDVSTFQKGASGARLHHTVIFPYEVTHHGHNHTVWERIE